MNHRSQLSNAVPFPGMPHASDLDILSTSRPVDVLSDTDLAALRQLRDDLTTICNHARQRGVKLIVDAEHRYVSVTIHVESPVVTLVSALQLVSGELSDDLDSSKEVAHMACY